MRFYIGDDAPLSTWSAARLQAKDADELHAFSDGFTVSQSIHGQCGDAETTTPGALFSRSLGVFVFSERFGFAANDVQPMAG